MGRIERQNWKTERFNALLKQYSEDLNYTEELDYALRLFISESRAARNFSGIHRKTFEESAYDKLTSILLGIDNRKPTDACQLPENELKAKLQHIVANGNGMGGYLRIHLVWVGVKLRRRLAKERDFLESYHEEQQSRT